MRPPYAALYLMLGIALGLWLHMTGALRDIQADRAAPSSHYIHVGPVYT